MRMKRVLPVIVLLLCITGFPLRAQDTFTEAYQRFRPYHYQTPRAWNRIRREVATHGKEKWPFIETGRLEMTLAGGWKGLIPSPVPGNTYFFKEVDDMGRIYSLMLTPDAYGYVVYPFKLEQQFKLSENDLLAPRILAKGFMNTLITDVSYETAQKLDDIIYVPDTTGTEEATPPEVYDENSSMGWLKDAEYYDLYNVKNFYCYFDNRSNAVRGHYKYVTDTTRYFSTEVETLKERILRSDSLYVMVPYWMTDVYLRLPLSVSSRIKRYGYLGYIIDPVGGTPEITNNWTSPNMMDFVPYKDKPYDLVAYCGDASSTNQFLTNPEACRKFIYSVLNYPGGMINRSDFASKPEGLNIYLPAFDFKEKRALTQLVKSLSLVIDSLCVNDSIYIYRDQKRVKNKDLGFFLTFSRKAAAEHSGFISGLQCFVDSVYFADFDSLGVSSRILYNDGSIDTSSVFTRVVNPFYLFRIPYKTIRPGVNNGNIWQLMECDYASGQWGLFFCIDLCILIMILALVVMRYISVPFNIYIEKYYTFVILLMITLVMELGVFFFFMIEALSPQVIYFNLETGSMTYLVLIALPIVPILFYFLILKLNKREPLP
ncbi:hypothetical protein AAE250_20155 [Bacteroides sp. GD17]|jgi:hypothetical protein|uniref:hypothetical protein n=1 Tax=Bacteroides sp. GD17 TaxID=3139826 RepID=UPI00204E54AA|nr:MAG TPA: hypothetical protein [Bacteriophage sp.]